ncbi:hypothetical protein GCM10023100_02180 [Actinocorallia cavernae]|uniref:Uncharacterized protein n=2 Tax=Actinomycetes TaxID=1760 RepID=A0ABN3M3T1_9ACTN
MSERVSVAEVTVPDAGLVPDPLEHTPDSKRVKPGATMKAEACGRRSRNRAFPGSVADSVAPLRR